MSPLNALPPPPSQQTGRPVRQPVGSEINLFDYIGVIMRRWKVVALALFLIFTIVAVYTFTRKPVYEATTTIQVKDDKQKAGNLGDINLTASNPVSAELELITSRSIAEKVVERLHLNWQVSEKSSNVSFKIGEFASTAQTPVYKIKLTGKDSFTVLDKSGTLMGQGKAGLLLKTKDLTLLISDLKGQPGDSFLLSFVPLNTAVVALRQGIKASEVGRTTGIIRVSYTNTNPVLARDVVNALAEESIQRSVEVKSAEAKRTVSFIREQIKEMKENLESSENKLQSYKSEKGLLQLDNEAGTLISGISEMEKRKTDLSLQRQQVDFEANAMRNAIKRGVVYAPGNTGSDSSGMAISALSAKLSELQVQKSVLLNQYTPDAQTVKSVDHQINAVQKKILAILETNRVNLARQEQGIAGQMSVYDHKIKKLPAVEQDLAKLTRVSKVNSDIYTFLLQKHEEARIAMESTISNMNIVDAAIIPEWPIKPDIKKNLLLGLLAGVALGIALAFLLEYLDDTIKDADQAKRALGLCMLATIPTFARNQERKSVSYAGIIPRITGREPDFDESIPDQKMLIAREEPKSMVSEAFRSLRTSLHFSAINKDKKTIVFTSTFPREGKSTVSANTAVVMAQTGAKVLMVDCDLRRSSQHHHFGLDKVPGLSEVLTRDVTFEQAINQTAIPGLDLLCAGTTPPNPSELLGSEEMRQLLMSQRDNYDYIVIDAPPVLAVTDAPVLTLVSDIVVLVMEAGRVPIKAAQHMREILARLNAPIAGLVLNDKTGEGERFSYYGKNYYGKAYGYRYGYGYGAGYYSDEKAQEIRKGSRWDNYIPETLRKNLHKYLPK